GRRLQNGPELRRRAKIQPLLRPLAHHPRTRPSGPDRGSFPAQDTRNGRVDSLIVRDVETQPRPAMPRREMPVPPDFATALLAARLIKQQSRRVVAGGSGVPVWRPAYIELNLYRPAPAEFASIWNFLSSDDLQSRRDGPA